jgi:limonene 1,2-monooxygenase
MMEESLDAILALFRTDEPVTRETDWFTMKEARLQLRPYSYPHPEVAVAAMVTPSGPRLAGQQGVSLLSLSMQAAGGFAAVGQAWNVVEEQAAKVGRPAPDRSTWRVLGNMHIAETREQAIEDCTYGLEEFANYFGGGAGFVPLALEVDGRKRTPREFAEAYAESDSVVVGTPADAIEHIEGRSRPRVDSARSSCSVTTGPSPSGPSTRTGSSPARSSRTSRDSWRRRASRTSGPRPSEASSSAAPARR